MKTYSNKRIKVSRAKIALGVHAENGSATSARRPSSEGWAGLQLKWTAVRALEVNAKLGIPSASGEGEVIIALTLGLGGDLGKSLHSSVENGESNIGP
jgi:hypothetical protein